MSLTSFAQTIRSVPACPHSNGSKSLILEWGEMRLMRRLNDVQKLIVYIALGKPMHSTRDLETAFVVYFFNLSKWEDLDWVVSILLTRFNVPPGPKIQWFLWFKPFFPVYHWLIITIKWAAWINSCLKFSNTVEYSTMSSLFAYLYCSATVLPKSQSLMSSLSHSGLQSWCCSQEKWWGLALCWLDLDGDWLEESGTM
jgi:hypothetical protein